MQALTAPPRTGMDPADVMALLLSDDLRVVAFGGDLLDHTNQFVAPLDPTVLGRKVGALRSAKVSWNGAVDLHRTCDITIARELAWDRDRVRLWQTLAAPSKDLEATFYRGVFVITRPSKVADGSSVTEHTCKGFDLLHRLRGPAGRTWSTLWTETGQATTVAAEVRRLLAAARFRSPVVLPAAAETKLLPEPLVWPVRDRTSWLAILVKIVTAGGFAGPRVDEVGTTHIDPIVPLEERPAEFDLDATSHTTVLGRVRTRTQDLTSVPNDWVFVNTTLDREPVPGDGMYLPDPNESQGPTSIAARDLVLTDVIDLEAADQAALIALGDERRASDMRAAGGRSLTTAPLPLMDHRDLYTVTDPDLGEPVRALATAWTEDLAGADTQLTLEEVP